MSAYWASIIAAVATTVIGQVPWKILRNSSQGAPLALWISIAPVFHEGGSARTSLVVTNAFCNWLGLSRIVWLFFQMPWLSALGCLFVGFLISMVVNAFAQIWIERHVVWICKTGWLWVSLVHVWLYSGIWRWN